MFNNIITSKSFPFFIAFTLAILTTGFLRLQLFSGLPEGDGGFYSFASQFIFNTLTNGEDLEGPLFFYQFIIVFIFFTGYLFLLLFIFFLFVIFGYYEIISSLGITIENS